MASARMMRGRGNCSTNGPYGQYFSSQHGLHRVLKTAFNTRLTVLGRVRFGSLSNLTMSGSYCRTRDLRWGIGVSSGGREGLGLHIVDRTHQFDGLISIKFVPCV